MIKGAGYIGDRRGVVLLITLVVLVVLAGLGYTLTTRIAAQIHRDQYIIDYQNARYACDSALKYAITSFGEIAIKPIDRPNDPDFSDVFAFTDEQYKRFLEEWLAAHPPKETYDQYGRNEEANSVSTAADSNAMNMSQLFSDTNDANAPTSFQQMLADMNSSSLAEMYRDPNKMVVPGPYGPPWPLVALPIEIEIGSAKVTIEIEDENAKLPLVWGTSSDKDKQQEVDAAISTFGEWMDMGAEKVDILKRDLKKIGEVKTYAAGTVLTVAASPETAQNAASKNAADPNAVRQGLSRRSRRGSQAQQQAIQQRQAAQAAQQAMAKPGASNSQIGDFVRLFHSSMMDIEPFAQPYIKTEQRTESVLKYMSRWGAAQVNVNTAPRQVLEAAFMFGGDAPAVTDEIIKLRQQKPFKDVNDLQKKVYKYADSIRKSKDFITTTSNVFSVKITAVSGVAKATTTAAVLMDGKKPQVIAIIAE